jgi:mannose-1-phosphate guanylyltransferase
VNVKPRDLALRSCCIVAASEERAERLSESLSPYNLTPKQAAVVKRGFLRQASLRARKLVSPANILVIGQEADRNIWEGPFWFTRPANRFISDHGAPTSLSTAAALLTVAIRTPSCLVAVLPSDFWVARESVLTEAIQGVFQLLPNSPESVATLGMIDAHVEIDQDYLVVGPNNLQKGAVIQARINRPEPRIAQQLVSEGAVVASGILLGYAQAFAARIYKYWPHLGRELAHGLDADSDSELENRLSSETYRHIPRSAINSIRLSPPTFPMRAFPVRGSGWCSRSTASEVHSEANEDWSRHRV